MNVRTQNITLSALFIAFGVLFPILFHSIGLGSILLPMFWPVAASAFFLPIPHAFAVGTLTPVLSMLITGMPPPPTLYRMIFELAVLATITGLLYRKTRYTIFWPLLGGLFTAMVAGLLGSAAIAPILGLPPEFYAIASSIKTIPGIITILALAPPILKRIKHEPIWSSRTTHVKEP